MSPMRVATETHRSKYVSCVGLSFVYFGVPTSVSALNDRSLMLRNISHKGIALAAHPCQLDNL